MDTGFMQLVAFGSGALWGILLGFVWGRLSATKDGDE